MHLTKLIMFLTFFSSGTFAYVIRAFTGASCSGNAREINVWDNTCRNSNIPQTKSFRVLKYGGRHQRAIFNKASNCLGSGTSQEYWADGGSNVFKRDKCITLDFTAMAYGSFL